MNKHFKEFLTHSALDFKLKGCPGVILEAKPDAPEVETKNVCAPISMELNKRFDELTTLLGISKRQFLRLALESALDESRVLVGEIDVFEHETPVSNIKTVTVSDEDQEIFEHMSELEKGAYLSQKWDEA